MNYVRGFLPWIAFAALSSLGWQWGALAGLGIGLAVILRERKAGMAADSLVLEISTAAYFAALTALAFAAPHCAVKPYMAAVSFGWLALTSWGSLALRRPFTLGIARRTTPREYWHTPQFLRINKVITAVWAGAFLLTAVALAACDHWNAAGGVKIAVQVAGFAVPAVFTARYPKAVRARLAARAPR